MNIDFTEKDLTVIWAALQDYAEHLIRTIEDYIDGDEKGIKQNLEVQSILYNLFCDLTSCTYALKRLQASKKLDLNYEVSKKVVDNYESHLHELVDLVAQLQSNGSRQ